MEGILLTLGQMNKILVYVGPAAIMAVSAYIVARRRFGRRARRLTGVLALVALAGVVWAGSVHIMVFLMVISELFSRF